MIKKLFQINLYVLVYERFMSPLENSIFFQIPKNSGRTHSGSFNFLFSFLIYPNPSAVVNTHDARQTSSPEFQWCPVEIT